jgi:hypothetical protein
MREVKVLEPIGVPTERIQKRSGARGTEWSGGVVRGGVVSSVGSQGWGEGGEEGGEGRHSGRSHCVCMVEVWKKYSVPS